MGYRHYLYKIHVELVEEIRELNSTELKEWGVREGFIDEGDEGILPVPLYDLGKEFFGFGKYYENAENVQRLGEPLFKDGDLQEEYSGYEPYIIGEDGFRNVLEYQKEKIKEQFEYMLYSTKEEREDKLDTRSREDMFEEYIKEMYYEWQSPYTGNTLAVNMGEGESVTYSWKYEYSIFELLRLYKSMDWDNYRLLLIGW